MPESARQDLVEWNPTVTPPIFLGAVLAKELSVTNILSQKPDVQVTDDRPFNEYFLIRHLAQAPGK